MIAPLLSPSAAATTSSASNSKVPPSSSLRLRRSSSDEATLTPSLAVISESSPLSSTEHDEDDDGSSIEDEATRTMSDAVATLPPGMEDPYADVRERMEALSLRDRQKHVFHICHDDDNEEVDGHALDSSGEPQVSFWVAIFTYVSYAILIFLGHCLDIVPKLYYALWGDSSKNRNTGTTFPSDNGRRFAPLLKSWENFYTRRLYTRVQDAFNRPICSNPGAHITVLERVSRNNLKSFEVVGGVKDHDDLSPDSYARGKYVRYVETPAAPGAETVARRALNLGSYNYLGFADDWHQTCRERVMGTLNDLPVSCSSSRSEFGTTALHREAERMVAEFLNKEDALVYNMGFNTNGTTIPCLVGKGDLIVSDALNHTSIVNGARASGAAIRIFRHNSAAALEALLREAIIKGRPRSRRPWRKILVIVEGIYSMEGVYCDLRAISAVCRKYGAYLYLDEAHSIGAMGSTGRGCSEYCSVDTRDIDIMMGTFTKSFGGMGGYIAGDRAVIAKLRRHCAGSVAHNSLSPVVAQQVISSLRVISGADGTQTGRIKSATLRDNSTYFRMRLCDMGLHVLGNYDSPVIPVMLYQPARIGAFSRECFQRGIAVVVVGFPAVPLLLARVRFCVSAGHTREDLDRALKEIEQVADLLQMK